MISFAWFFGPFFFHWDLWNCLVFSLPLFFFIFIEAVLRVLFTVGASSLVFLPAFPCVSVVCVFHGAMARQQAMLRALECKERCQ